MGKKEMRAIAIFVVALLIVWAALHYGLAQVL